MEKYILAIDQGTTGTTTLIVDRQMVIKAKVNQEFRQIFPQPGWVEHNLEDIWNSVKFTIKQALEKAQIDPRQVAAIGITNQRETVALWDRDSGKAVHNAIVWQCRRTAPICNQLKRDGLEDLFREKTGLVLDPYFSGTKIKYLLDLKSNFKQQAQQGKLAAGTIDSFLVFRLSNKKVHVTDVTNASRTLLMDIHQGQWDEQLLSILDIPVQILPQITSSSEIYGYTQGIDELPNDIPICGIAGDQQAALFGQACFSEGEAKCTYGTGSFLLINTGSKPIKSEHSLLTTIAWKRGGQITYALEGSAFIAGACVQWLRDGLGIIKSAPQIEDLARQVEETGDVVFVPALTGLGAPHWRSDARGMIRGLTRDTTAAHIARAALEGIAFQNYDILTAMCKDMGKELLSLKVDGGAAANSLLMQFQADILAREIVRPKVLETTGVGSAFLAGLAIGYWESEKEISTLWQEERRFSPQMESEQVQKHIQKWHQSVKLA